jgi:hypothetical protein
MLFFWPVVIVVRPGAATTMNTVKNEHIWETGYSTYDFVFMPQGQAMAQPFAQKHIQLGLFVRLMH